MRDARRSQTNFGAFFVWRFVAVKRPARPPRLFTRRAVRAAPPPHVALFVAPRSSRSRHVPSCREKPKMPNVGRWKLSPRAVPDTRAAGAFSRRRSRPTSHKPMRKQGQLAPHFCKVHHMRVLGGSGAGRRRPRAPQKPRLLRGIAPPMKEVAEKWRPPLWSTASITCPTWRAARAADLDRVRGQDAARAHGAAVLGAR